MLLAVFETAQETLHGHRILLRLDGTTPEALAHFARDSKRGDRFERRVSPRVIHTLQHKTCRVLF